MVPLSFSLLKDAALVLLLHAVLALLGDYLFSERLFKGYSFSSLTSSPSAGGSQRSPTGWALSRRWRSTSSGPPLRGTLGDDGHASGPPSDAAPRGLRGTLGSLGRGRLVRPLLALFLDPHATGLRVRALFLGSFVFSGMLLCLIILELAQAGDPWFRKRVWQFELLATSILSSVVIPGFQIFLIVRSPGQAPSMFRILCGTVAYCMYLIGFFLIGFWFPISTSFNIFSIEALFGRVAIIGITLSALLAGYGAVNGPYSNMTRFIGARSVDISTIRHQEAQLRLFVRQLYAQRLRLATLENRYAELQAGRRLSSGGGPPEAASLSAHGQALRDKGAPMSDTMSVGLRSAQSFFSALFPDVAPVEAAPSGAKAAANLLANIHELEGNIAALELVQSRHFSTLSAIRNAFNRRAFSQTLHGRYLDALGHVLSFYGAYRLLMSVINVLSAAAAGGGGIGDSGAGPRAGPHIDPVSRALGLVSQYLGAEQATALSLNALGVHISFLLIGILVFTNVRGFLFHFIKLFHSLSTSQSGAHLALLMAQLQGAYACACVLQLRGNLPDAAHSAVTAVLGGARLAFRVFTHWFDLVFLMAACLTGVAAILSFVRQRHAEAAVAADEANVWGSVVIPPARSEAMMRL
ncbi:hypothetical protein H696_00561 [Fonticula alba]|uniref:Abscisic acid G-protein coupled receptor-like domain-containing protein n=1 Tax=Fonticula alba TaxID=691883 RepID=A0A058ZGD6_FONAL|nr:hypothetical protein H696_00561 [Fonticula alba]KCV73011.1 hypothetical protein H696_00561 [Fonticula alba]|eukprot:XP_009492712.1 hypothetical protein H696_00561 [Fonticula alba]